MKKELFVIAMVKGNYVKFEINRLNTLQEAINVLKLAGCNRYTIQKVFKTNNNLYVINYVYDNDILKLKNYYSENVNMTVYF